jgi:hypothetical protein
MPKRKKTIHAFRMAAQGCSETKSSAAAPPAAQERLTYARRKSMGLQRATHFLPLLSHCLDFSKKSQKLSLQ